MRSGVGCRIGSKTLSFIVLYDNKLLGWIDGAEDVQHDGNCRGDAMAFFCGVIPAVESIRYWHLSRVQGRVWRGSNENAKHIQVCF